MDSDQLSRQDSPLQLLFGSDHLYLTAIECEIYGTDANGHALQFRGTVALSQEHAP